jgi:hypothetical protein
MKNELKLLQNWNWMLESLDKAKKHWEALAKLHLSIDASGVDPTVARAMTITCLSRNFDLLLPDLVRYWRTHGGFERLVVEEELVEKFKEKKVTKKEKKDD